VVVLVVVVVVVVVVVQATVEDVSEVSTVSVMFDEVGCPEVDVVDVVVVVGTLPPPTTSISREVSSLSDSLCTSNIGSPSKRPCDPAAWVTTLTRRTRSGTTRK
jgi:hypothetical protein